MNFQEDAGKAKEYQVKQLLAAIEELTGAGTQEQEPSDAEV